ncbi:hypothetical protein NDU88_008467 [Pleurodeles waltl]|uniref:Uncharacterized protein n=1 Tax=Pleurodeles waltl TaxID=8319 RepID=A0AAV7NW43_PLEWA|nr:hypothetical protein NDU88_008467 [Pleurodeles waltl]
MRVRKAIAQQNERPNHMNPCRLSRYSVLRAVKGVPWTCVLIASGACGTQEQAHLTPTASAVLQQGPAISLVTGRSGAATGTATHSTRAPLQLQRRSEPCCRHRSDMTALTTGVARPLRFPCTGCLLQLYMPAAIFRPYAAT